MLTENLPSRIEGRLAELRGKGIAYNVVRDHRTQLEGAEWATWTGAKLQLAALRSGPDVWLEVRKFGEDGARTVTVSERDPSNFAKIVLDFAAEDSRE